MATKNKPGEFDCYANADPDEYMFVLLARDSSAAFVVRVWAWRYWLTKLLPLYVQRFWNGDRFMDAQLWKLMQKRRAKYAEAMSCALEMEIQWVTRQLEEMVRARGG